jgi:hypothetical protein
VIRTCIVKPKPAPITYIDSAANQYGECASSVDSMISATITVAAPRIGNSL